MAEFKAIVAMEAIQGCRTARSWRPCKNYIPPGYAGTRVQIERLAKVLDDLGTELQTNRTAKSTKL